MDTTELYPRQVNPIHFEEAYLLHKAASHTLRSSYPTDESGKLIPSSTAAPSQLQRGAVLKIAAQLMVLERNKLLDRFCVEWLKYRDLPMPTTGDT